MGWIEDVLWKISPMGQVEAILGAAFNTVENLANGRLPKPNDIAKLISTELDSNAGADGPNPDAPASCAPDDN